MKKFRDSNEYMQNTICFCPICGFEINMDRLVDTGSFRCGRCGRANMIKQTIWTRMQDNLGWIILGLFSLLMSGMVGGIIYYRGHAIHGISDFISSVFIVALGLGIVTVIGGAFLLAVVLFCIMLLPPLVEWIASLIILIIDSLFISCPSTVFKPLFFMLCCIFSLHWAIAFVEEETLLFNFLTGFGAMGVIICFFWFTVWGVKNLEERSFNEPQK